MGRESKRSDGVKRAVRAVRHAHAAADPLQQDLAYALAIARQQWRGSSLREVAARVAEVEGKDADAVAATSIFHLEVGRSWPKAERLRALATVLDVPTWRLLDRQYMELPREARQVLDTVRAAIVDRYAPTMSERRERAARRLQKGLQARTTDQEE